MSATPEPSEQGSAAPDELSERDLRVLAFERDFTRHAGAKEEAIRENFALSAARYYQVLNAVIDSPAAVRSVPMLVKRLQRIRDARTQARAQRTFTSSGPGGSPSRPLPTESND